MPEDDASTSSRPGVRPIPVYTGRLTLRVVSNPPTDLARPPLFHFAILKIPRMCRQPGSGPG
jgi:hypothetical protein